MTDAGREVACPICGYETLVFDGRQTCPDGCPDGYDDIERLAKEWGTRPSNVVSTKLNVVTRHGDVVLVEKDSIAYEGAEAYREGIVDITGAEPLRQDNA